MSFNPPAGILDIGNATLRVGKLEVAETTGLNQGLQNIVKNDLLITETDSYTTSKSWGLKLPTTWVAEFDIQGQTGKYVEFNFYNEGSTSNAQGYTLNFKDTSLTLKYDNGSTLASATIPTIVGTFRKVHIFFERNVIAVSIDGTRYIYDKRPSVLSRVISTTGSAFLNAFIQSDHGGNSIFKNLRIVNGRFISDETSNIAFVGGNLGVGVNSPKESLDIRGNMHLTRVSNVSQVKVDSNVVTEYTGPHDRPLRKYPEVPLTADAATGSGYKGYKVTFSAQQDTSTRAAFRLFDHDTTDTNRWQSGTGTYNTSSPHAAILTNNLPRLTDVDGTNHDGHWVGLQLPVMIKLDHIKFTTYQSATRIYSPSNYVILGSNTGLDNSWNLLKEVTDQLYTTNKETVTVHVNATNKYKYYIWLIKNLGSTTGTSGSTVIVPELEYYGHEEGDASLDTTLKTVYNVPATTGTQLEVYYDGQDYTGVTSTVTDKAGTATNATISNSGGTITFDSTYKAWTFGGSSGRTDTFRSSTLPSTFTGNQVHSITLWFNMSNISDGSIFVITPSTGENGDDVIMGQTQGNGARIAYSFWGNDVSFALPTNLTTETWYHLGMTYDATDNSTGRKMFLNGIECTAINTASGSLSLPNSNMIISFANRVSQTSYPFFGSIANFRLYSKALNADQVKELYDYQKDYFLGSKSQVTLYKGHLGVGVTEPSGQLELAGDERIQEYPPKGMFLTNTNNFNSSDPPSIDSYIEGHGVFTATSSMGNVYESQGPHRAFNDEYNWVTYPSHIYWGDANAGYDVNTYLYTGNVQLSSKDGTPKGQWIKLKLPYHIKVNSYFTQTPNTGGMSGYYGVKSGQLWGSNDDVNWSFIHGFSDLNATTNGHYHDVSTNNESYKYLALIIIKNFGQNPTYVSGGSGDRVGIQRIRYFGTPGPTTLDKGSLTLGRSLDVPRISRYDVDTETPRPEKLVVDFDTTVNSSPTDISGQGNHGRFNGDASYSPADKAFVFDGNGDFIYLEQNDIAGTNATQTWSLWFKSDGGLSDSEYDAIFEAGVRSANEAFGAYLHQDGSDLRVFYHRYLSNLPLTDDGYIVTPNKWYHIAGTTDMSGNVSRFYVNGEIFAQDTYSSFNITHPRVRIGSNVSGGEFYKGLISNFKLYNVALEPSEIKKLYNLGRTGRSMVISDTAVGIGKAPEAQLDVRGSVGVAGYLGIGVNPGDSFGGALHVATRHGESLASANRRYFRYDEAIRTGDGSARGSIYGRWDIISSAYFISTAGTASASDGRIKKNIIDVNDSSALTTLRLLKPKRYEYRDTVERGTEPVWGFIAQEVRDTLPYATQLRTEFVPNIYQLANVTDSNVITFSGFNTSELEDSTVLKVISSNDEEHEVRITEIVDDNTIRVNTGLDGWTGSVDDEGNIVSGNQIFVYGQKIDDFIFVKKDAIWTIATAALQEVDRQLQFERARNDALEARVTALEQAKYM